MTGIRGSKYRVSCLHRLGTKAQWIWPTRVDELEYDHLAVKMTIPAPKQLGRRAIYLVPELK